MKYIIFKATNGKVLRTMNAPVETLQVSMGDDEDFLPYLGSNMDIHVDITTRMIVPGAIDDRTPEQKAKAEWILVRRERDRLLQETDWVSTRYIDQLGSIPESWSTYRQALRDVMSQPDPFNIDWPVIPPL